MKVRMRKKKKKLRIRKKKRINNLDFWKFNKYLLYHLIIKIYKSQMLEFKKLKNQI